MPNRKWDTIKDQLGGDTNEEIGIKIGTEFPSLSKWKQVRMELSFRKERTCFS